MSYDVHITRAEFWAENDAVPIPLGQWIDVAAADPTLDHRGDGLVVASGIRADGHDAALHWFDGDVHTADPDANTLALMRDLAQRLGASVQGDDGETY